MSDVQAVAIPITALLTRRAIDGEREYTAQLWSDGKISVRVLAASDYHMIDEGEASGVNGTIFLDVIRCHPAEWLEALMEQGAEVKQC